MAVWKLAFFFFLVVGFWDCTDLVAFVVLVAAVGTIAVAHIADVDVRLAIVLWTIR